MTFLGWAFHLGQGIPDRVDRARAPGQKTRYTEERSVHYSTCGMNACRGTTAESEARVRALA